MESLAITVAIMLLVGLVSAVGGLGLAVWARRTRRVPVAVGAHVALLPATFLAIPLLDTVPGVAFLAVAVLGHAIAATVYVRPPGPAGPTG